MEKYTFPNDPIADPAAVVAGDNFRFTLINDTVLRYEWSEDGVFEDRPSTFALNRRFPAPTFTVDNTGEYLHIRTASYHVTYNRKRFDGHGFVISFNSKNTLWGADWRYGETPENLGGTARTLDDVNGRCKLEPGILSRAGYSVLDDSNSMLFDGQGFVAPRRPGDRIDGYLLCYGYDYKRAMSSFYAVSGKQPPLPRWALGNWWSRYYDYTDKEYLRLMDKFENEQVPLTVAVLDMGWHKVHGDDIPHAGWTGYTWDKKFFPDPTAFTQALHERGLHITLNDHPHAGVHHHEEMYEAMAKDLGHDTSNQAPILFNPTSPKFMHSYLNTLHRKLEDDGCDFWWIDWQQGPTSRIPGLDPLWLLNHFHFVDHQLKGDKRSLIFSRFAGPGSHRYPVGFSGDTIMTWESLEFQPEFTATSSNIGYGWWSHDIGGHMGGYRDDELATRWVQFGVLSPLMRLHSSSSPWASKEPWLYQQEHQAVMKWFLQLRHRLVPYLYTMNAGSAYRDEPLVQPLYWKFPSRDDAYSKPNQYYLGPSLVVAPIVKPRDRRTTFAAVDVWVPPGRHVDILTGLVYDGDRHVKMHRNIQTIPILAPEGAIIPLDQASAPKNGCKNPSGLEVLVVLGKDGEFTIVEDIEDDEATSASKSTSREIHLNYSQAEGRLEFDSAGKQWSFKFLSLMSIPADLSMSVDGLPVPDCDLDIEDYPNLPGLSVRLPNSYGANCTIVLGLGSNPQLGVLDVSKRIQQFIMDYQMDMGLKDEIWKAITTSHGLSGKIGQLMALGLDQELISPIVELLTADSREKV
ncbi:glycosyl hydrolases family 31-domain-containing protein [Thelonectria olida]|uniref:alpha-glucosidase n=1 Tax=Thelonectria olida TaxID=1576542 RepID=A0A9P8VZL8_9HYPO|nr:glycosyl hydrolases family 31-domain-containing protein [Thelonectria olida]